MGQLNIDCFLDISNIGNQEQECLGNLLLLILVIHMI